MKLILEIEVEATRDSAVQYINHFDRVEIGSVLNRFKEKVLASPMPFGASGDLVSTVGARIGTWRVDE